MKALFLIFRVLRGFAAVTILGAVIVGPFVLKIWKEGEGQYLSMQRLAVRKELLEVESRISSLELEIRDLTSAEHLLKYTDSIDDIHKAPREDIFVLRRKSSGAYRKSDDPLGDLIKKYMRPQ
ncbi:MAG: hypothetical protein ACQEQV_00470 [Fibrobacterota bacterium]